MILTLKETSFLNIDVSPITPDLLRRSMNEVHALPLGVGTEHIPLGDLFTVTSVGGDSLVIRNAQPCLTRVAANMSDGEMVIEGDCGDYAAYSMHGGEVRIKGGIGACAAANMSGGRLFIEGHAGDALGAAPVGATHGMHGGTIVVGGDIGARAFERMRRGTAVALGDCGDYCANNMIAGTVFTLGKMGRSLGYEMRRGTLVVKDADAIDHGFFVRSGAQTHFMALLSRYIRSLDKSTQHIPEGYSKRYIGDISVGGLGEIMVL